MPHKKLRIKTFARCTDCLKKYGMESLMEQNESIRGHVPFGAKSSSTIMICPDCNSSKFELHYEYQNYYRIRCQDCQQMFDSEETYRIRCPKCEKEHLTAFSRLGASF